MSLPRTTDANLDCVFVKKHTFIQRSLIIKNELDGIELVTRPVFSLGGSQTDNIFRAVQLSVPSVIAHLRVVHRGPDNNVLDSREYNFDLNSGTTYI